LEEKIDISNLTKLYYTIGEVAETFDVNPSLIRFWEKEFPIIQPKKNKKGNRLFTPKDIENFNKIYQLVKIQGFTLDGAKKELKKKKINDAPLVDSSEKNTDVIERLEAIKRFLLQLKK
jgi:DNA-binding transcriptional MerR regulator